MKSLILFFTLMTAAVGNAELSGSYLVHKASCFPHHPSAVQPIVMTVDADSIHLSFSIKMYSEFQDVGIFDFPIDTLYVGDRANGWGIAYIREVGGYANGGNKFSYVKYDDRRAIDKTTFALAPNGSLIIKRRLDNGFAGTCTASKIQ